MPTDKDRIIEGDTFPIKYVCYQPSEDTYNQVPKNVQSATVEIYDTQNAVAIEFEEGVTAAEALVENNIVTYTIPHDLLVAGDYRVTTRMVFADGQRASERKQLKVLGNT